IVGRMNTKSIHSYISKSYYSGSNYRYSFMRENGEGHFLWDDGDANTHAKYPDTSTDKEIVMAHVDRVSKVHKAFKNGVEKASLNNGNGFGNTINMTSPNHFYIGAYNNADGVTPKTDIMLDGEIYEIIMLDKAMTDEERAAIHHYLAKKWGLGSVVDSDGDGVPDADELAAGFNATDANSKPITSDLLMWFPFNGSNESVVGDYKITTLDPAAPDALTYVSDVSQDGTQSLFKYNPYYTNHNVPRA
ncbi:MAG: hypothetical protein ACO3MX_07840, partial [Candidatus Puniceispirillaceae bacterium]